MCVFDEIQVVAATMVKDHLQLVAAQLLLPLLLLATVMVVEAGVAQTSLDPAAREQVQVQKEEEEKRKRKRRSLT